MTLLHIQAQAAWAEWYAQNFNNPKLAGIDPDVLEFLWMEAWLSKGLAQLEETANRGC